MTDLLAHIDCYNFTLYCSVSSNEWRSDHVIWHTLIAIVLLYVVVCRVMNDGFIGTH